MGCIFSIFKKDNDNIENTDTLIVTKHCFVCNKVFSNNIEYLIWSPIRLMKGSVFVTISDQNNNTYSCFGSWENNKNSLFDCLIDATKSVIKYRWGNNSPVTPTNNILNTNYYISITLISPKSTWTKVENINNAPEKIGYVYFNNNTNKVGMTYLPSVWKLLTNKKDFFDGIYNKQGSNYPSKLGWELNRYNSISWEYQM